MLSSYCTIFFCFDFQIGTRHSGCPQVPSPNLNEITRLQRAVREELFCSQNFDMNLIYTIKRLTIVKYYDLFLSGIQVTLLVAFVGFAIALVFALVIVFARRSRNPVLRAVGNFWIQLSRNTPIFVSLIWVFYALPNIIGINYSSLVAAIIAITFQAAGFQSEVYRAGIESIDRGQIRAAKALGMTEFVVMRRVVLPQAFRRIIPPTVNVLCSALKSTSLISVIAAPDMMYHAQRLVSSLYKPMEIFTTAAIIYVIIVGITAFAADSLNKRIKGVEVRED
jgi:polar amino acid transport system permease protein